MEKHFINVKYTDKQLIEFKNAWLSKYDRKEPEHGLLNPGLFPSLEANRKKALFTEGPQTPFPFFPPKIEKDNRAEEERAARQDHYNSIRRKMDALETMRAMWMFARPFVPAVAAEQVDALIRVAYRIVQAQARERMAPQMMAQLDLLEETAKRQLEVQEVLKLNINGKDKEFAEASAMFRNKYGVTTNLWNYNENLKQQIGIQTGSLRQEPSTTALVPVNFDLNQNLEEYYQKRAEMYYKPALGHSNVVPNFIANSNTAINNSESVAEKADLSSKVEVDTESKRLGRLVIDNNAKEIDMRHAATNLEKEYTRPTNVTQSLLPVENAKRKQELAVYQNNDFPPKDNKPQDASKNELAVYNPKDKQPDANKNELAIYQNNDYFPPKDTQPLDPNSKYPFEVTEPQKGYPNVGQITPLEAVQTIPVAKEPVAVETGDPQVDATLQISQGENTISSREPRLDNSQSIFPGFIINYLNYKTNSRDLVTEITKIPPNGQTHIYDLSFLDLIDSHKYAMEERKEDELWKRIEARRQKEKAAFLATPSKIYELGKYALSKIYDRATSQLSKEANKVAFIGDAIKESIKFAKERSAAKQQPVSKNIGLDIIDLYNIGKKMKEEQSGRLGGLYNLAAYMLDAIPGDIMGPDMEDLVAIKDYLKNFLPATSPNNDATIETVVKKSQENATLVKDIETMEIENLVVDKQLTSIEQPITEPEEKKAPIQKIDITKYFPVLKECPAEKILSVIPEVKKEIEKEEKIPDLNPAYNNILVHNAVLEKQVKPYERMNEVAVAPDYWVQKTATPSTVSPEFDWVRKTAINTPKNTITPSAAAPDKATDNPYVRYLTEGLFKETAEQEAPYTTKEAQLKPAEKNFYDWWKSSIEEEYDFNSEFEKLPYTKEDLSKLAKLIVNDRTIYLSKKLDAFDYVRKNSPDKIAGIDENKLHDIIGHKYGERPLDAKLLWDALQSISGAAASTIAAFKGSQYLSQFVLGTNDDTTLATTKGFGIKGAGICKCGSRKNLLVHDKKPDDYTCEKCYHKAGKLTNSRFTDKTANIVPLSNSKHPKHKQAYQSNLELENYERLANSNIPTAYDNFFDNPVDSKFINRINSGLLIGRGVRDCDHRYIAHAMGVNEHNPDMLNHYGKQNLAMMITKLLHAQQDKPKRAINMHNLAKVSTLEQELRDNPKLLEHYTV